MNYAQHFSSLKTTQKEPIPGREPSMVANSEGGFVFPVDDWIRLERFLILGNEGGSFYATEKHLTVENAQCVLRCYQADPGRTVRTIVEVSEQGRAPKNDPAIFALALCGREGLAVLPRVCRIPTHLFQFIEAVEQVRGWGRGLRHAVSRWYLDRPVEQLAYHLIKYQQRGGWSHRDLLRLSHPQTDDPARQALFRWVTGHSEEVAELPEIIIAFKEVQSATTPRLVELIHQHNLPRECIPTEKLNEVAIWEALLVRMPLTALIRNLGKMTSIGLLTPMSEAVRRVTEKLSDADYLQRSRIHPIAVLVAAKTYASGHGLKGSLSWTPVSAINDVLDAAFYHCFRNVIPAGKRTLIAIDVSGSMGWGSIAGTSLTPREAAAALALVTAKTESQYQIMAFSHTLVPLDVSGCSRLTDVLAKTSAISMGGTDCSLPMVSALEQGWPVDTFIVLTDSETYFGDIHPCQALVQYRRKLDIPAKLAVVAMLANQFSIADPQDAGMMDFVGFDTSVPNLLNDFSRGSSVPASSEEGYGITPIP